VCVPCSEHRHDIPPVTCASRAVRARAHIQLRAHHMLRASEHCLLRALFTTRTTRVRITCYPHMITSRYVYAPCYAHSHVSVDTCAVRTCSLLDTCALCYLRTCTLLDTCAPPCYAHNHVSVDTCAVSTCSLLDKCALRVLRTCTLLDT
jgi:hypothetical protein